jgi:hypothetical protein
VTRRGEWMAAVLSCGPGACLSHGTAAALWGIRQERASRIHLTTPAESDRRQPGIVAHRRSTVDRSDITRHDHIPVTTPVRTLIDLALVLPREALEAAVNEADKLELVDPERLRAALEDRAGQHGVPALRELLDRRIFVLTRSALERMFLPIARLAGLPRPLTGRRVNGFEVDFHWPDRSVPSRNKSSARSAPSASAWSPNWGFEPVVAGLSPHSRHGGRRVWT